MFYHNHIKCRVCGGENLIPYLDLGELPLTNNLCSSWEEKSDLYPLKLMICGDCWLSQLSIVVNPQIMFGNYVYRSSISNDFMKHCLKMAYDLKEEYGLDENTYHIDIAGNDGALLSQFQFLLNHNVLNIDPARNLAAICESKGIKTVPKFWSSKVALSICETWHKADLITATNVLAHVDDLREFLEGVKLVLSPDGVLIVECPYLIDFIENVEFSTLYQEHVSVISIYPLNRLCNEIGLSIMKVEKQNIHCGSVRIHIGNGKQQKSVFDFIEAEKPYRELYRYQQFAIKSHYIINSFRDNLLSIKSSGKTISGFAASAKGNTLLNCARIDYTIIDSIIDDTPEKQGMFSPGTRIPIVSMSEFIKKPSEYLTILSWNFKDEIVNKCRNAGYGGRFIIGVPSFNLFD
jgi:hypothetical protein